ncbi:hypothetical protein QEZ47_20895 [Aminobacter anthyllidis]|uniref:hypothetical protein n=1 Tax=Aminobacter anthyllidis TaxID=1035067 RepID=UPI0024544E1A|nr:hypothetical protein [Aminobacter anthyllidis]MDH4987931.1 hypothetical protein [Aminobacter anthyllidis]
MAEQASSAAIAQLRSGAPVDLPESYFSLLSFSNGGEGPLPIQPLWLCLYPAEEATRIELEGTFQVAEVGFKGSRLGMLCVHSDAQGHAAVSA